MRFTLMVRVLYGMPCTLSVASWTTRFTLTRVPIHKEIITNGHACDARLMCNRARMMVMMLLTPAADGGASHDADVLRRDLISCILLCDGNRPSL